MWWYTALDIAIWAAGGFLFWKAFETWQGINRHNLSDTLKKAASKK